MQLVEIPLADLLVNPDNIRGDVGDVSDLAQSIVTQGLLSPLLVTQLNGDGTYVVIAGNRRLVALQLLAAKGTKVDPVPCVLHDSMADAERIEKQLVENLQRAELNPMEEAKAYESLCFHFGLSQREAAEKVGVDQATISKRLALLRLPEAVQDAVARGKLPTAQAVLLAKLKDHELIENLTEGGHTVPADHRIKAAIERQAGEAKLSKVIKALDDAGIDAVKALPSGFYRSEPVASVEDARKLAGQLDDDTVLIASVGYDNEPSLYLAARRYANTVEPDADGETSRKAVERESRRIEREARRDRTQALVAVVTKATKTDVAAMATQVVADSLSYSTAKAACELLDLEPHVTETESVDYSTGEKKVQRRKDYLGTVDAWAEQGPRERIQVAAAVLLAWHAHHPAVVAYLAEREVPDLDAYVAEARERKAAEAEAEPTE